MGKRLVRMEKRVVRMGKRLARVRIRVTREPNSVMRIAICPLERTDVLLFS